MSEGRLGETQLELRPRNDQGVPGEGLGYCGRKRHQDGGEDLQGQASVKLATDAKGFPVDPEFMASLKEQIERGEGTVLQTDCGSHC